MSGALVLLSGGMDSAVCLYEAIEAHGTVAVECLFFDWGQLAVEQERRCCSALCRAAGVAPQIEVELHFPYRGPLTDESLGMPRGRTPSQISGGGVEATFFPGRNLVMLASAFGIAAARGIERIYFGATAQDGSGYPDCRAEFLRAMEDACSAGVGREIELVTPLLGMSKARVALRGEELGVPWDLTFSCYAPRGGEPCGTCDSCVLRGNALHRDGQSP